MPKNLKNHKGSPRKATLPKNKRSYTNRSKIELGGPKMEPGCIKSGAKIEKNALNRPKWLPDGSQDPFTGNDSQIFRKFWVPPGIPKITKNRFFPQKAVLGSAFSSIFAANGLNLENRAPAQAGARFSQNHDFHFFPPGDPKMDPKWLKIDRKNA